MLYVRIPSNVSRKGIMYMEREKRENFIKILGFYVAYINIIMDEKTT